MDFLTVGLTASALNAAQCLASVLLTPALLAARDYYHWWPWLVSGGFVMGIIGLLLGNSKNMGCAGFLLGFFLGPLGLIILLLWKGRSY